MSVQEIVETARTLSVDEQKQLIKLLVDLLTEPKSPPRKRSLLELRGLGKEIWDGVDAQQYVDQQRDEWDAPQ